jgi:hypothetical protein
MATRVASNNDGNGDNGKSNGKGDQGLGVSKNEGNGGSKDCCGQQ